MEWLARLGLKRAGDLQKLPRKTLAVRLGGDVARVMALLAGDDSTAPTPYVPPEIPSERIDLEYGAESAEALLFVAKTACDRLAVRLQGRALSAAQLTLILHLDRGVLRVSNAQKDKEPEPHLGIKLPTPVRDAASLLTIVRVRIESWIAHESTDGQGGSSLPAPVLALTLQATELAQPFAVPLDLFVHEARATRKLGPLLAELDAELGDRVGTLAVADSWILEKRSVLVPVGKPRPECTNQVAPFALAEPIRLIPPIPIAPDDPSIRLVRLLGRWEALEWWRDTSMAPRDAFAAWTNDQMAFVVRHEGRTWIRGWME